MFVTIIVSLDDLSGEVFDLLITLGDFLEFKDLMLSFKRSKAESKSSKSGGGLDLSITGKHV
jgi:hypothetical protein